MIKKIRPQTPKWAPVRANGNTPRFKMSARTLGGIGTPAIHAAMHSAGFSALRIEARPSRDPGLVERDVPTSYRREPVVLLTPSATNGTVYEGARTVGEMVARYYALREKPAGHLERAVSGAIRLPNQLMRIAALWGNPLFGLFGLLMSYIVTKAKTTKLGKRTFVEKDLADVLMKLPRDVVAKELERLPAEKREEIFSLMIAHREQHEWNNLALWSSLRLPMSVLISVFKPYPYPSKPNPYLAYATISDSDQKEIPFRKEEKTLRIAPLPLLAQIKQGARIAVDDGVQAAAEQEMETDIDIAEPKRPKINS